MPEFRDPGVFVEEVAFRGRSIEGVGTSTAAFIGPTRYGPVDGAPALLTSLADYERTYGDGRPLDLGGAVPANDTWQAVRAFFANGGARLHVARVARGAQAAEGSFGAAPAGVSGPGARSARIRARYPGAAGSRRVRITLEAGPDLLSGGAAQPGGAADGDVVMVSRPGPDPTAAFAVLAIPAAADDPATWTLADAFTIDAGGAAATGADATGLDDPQVLSALPRGAAVSIVRATVTDVPVGQGEGDGETWAGLALGPGDGRGGAPDSLFARFAADAEPPPGGLPPPIVIEPVPVAGERGVPTGIGLLRVILLEDPGLQAALADPGTPAPRRSFEVELTGGTDGDRPGPADYAGSVDPVTGRPSGLVALEGLADVSVVAAPGATRGYAANRADADATLDALIAHCERMRYRIAVLDSGDGQAVDDVRAMRSRLDSGHAALYYPWVVVMDPISREEAVVPPSGFVAGLYARSDRQRGAARAPANEAVTGVLRFETELSRADLEVLNPEGINCLRSFAGRGHRLWGARTLSSDPEWKYVSLRRYIAYLERSIEVGTQWAVFEPNGERLWADVRRAIEDFLLNEFRAGAVAGRKPDDAFFARCDRSTMTQDDLDDGRLVCLVGVAPLRPAEFVIFRIGQWTVDRKPPPPP